MKAEIEKYITSYDKQVMDRIAQEKAGEEDDEGWVTVTSGKKRGQFAPTRKESTIGKVQQKEQQRTKKKQLLNFYTFQIRETKKQSEYNCITGFFVAFFFLNRISFDLCIPPFRFSRVTKKV